MKEDKKIIVRDWSLVRDSSNGLIFAAPADLKIKIKGTSVTLDEEEKEILDEYFVSPVLYSFLSQDCADTGLSRICVLEGPPDSEFKDIMDHYGIDVSYYFRKPPSYTPRLFKSKF